MRGYHGGYRTAHYGIGRVGAYPSAVQTGIWIYRSGTILYVPLIIILVFLAIPVIVLSVVLKGGILSLIAITGYYCLIGLLPMIVIIPFYIYMYKTAFQDRVGYYTKFIPGDPNTILSIVRNAVGKVSGIANGHYGGVPTRKGSYTYIEWFTLQEGLNVWVRHPKIPMSGVTMFGAEIGVGKVTDENRQTVQNLMNAIDFEMTQNVSSAQNHSHQPQPLQSQQPLTNQSLHRSWSLHLHYIWVSDYIHALFHPFILRQRRVQLHGHCQMLVCLS